MSPAKDPSSQDLQHGLSEDAGGGGWFTRPRTRCRDLTARAVAQSCFITRAQSKRQMIYVTQRADPACLAVFNASEQPCHEPRRLPRAPAGRRPAAVAACPPSPSLGSRRRGRAGPGLAHSRAGAKHARVLDFAELGFCLDSGQGSPETSPQNLPELRALFVHSLIFQQWKC